MLVSVIIPCYNSEKSVSGCIDSVLKQDYENTELILVDDGSSDNTIAILEKVSLSNPAKIKLIKQENCGASAARNAGLKISKGEYIQFLDSDDTLLPQKISHQVSLLKENNFPDLIAAPFDRYYKDKGRVTVIEGDEWLALIKGRLGSTCSNLFKKSALEKAGAWNENQKSSQESELMFRMLKSGCKVLVDKKSLTEVYAGAANSISSLAPLENLKRFFQLRIDFFDFLKEKKLLTEERKNALSQILLGTLRMIYKRDKETALNFYENKYRPSFKPVAGPGISKWYVTLMSMFGFNFSEKLFSIIHR